MKKYFFLFTIIAFVFTACTKDSASINSSSGNSTGGSMARFTLVGDYLYAINNQLLKSYNVSNPASPVLESTVNIGPNIETIFPFKGVLFIGSNQTMYAYNITNPGKPTPYSATNYVIPFTGRDPVVANDTMAYSSIRNANAIGGMMSVMNIKNLQAPAIMNQINFTTNIYGLGLADTALYLCQGNAGLRTFSLKNSPINPVIRSVINDGETYYDVIPAGNILYTWIEGGNSIFNISDRMNPTLLSKTKN